MQILHLDTEDIPTYVKSIEADRVARWRGVEFEYIDKSTNILTGGPEPDNYADGAESLGQLFIKKLTEYGDYIMMVCSLFILSKVKTPKITNPNLKYASFSARDHISLCQKCDLRSFELPLIVNSPPLSLFEYLLLFPMTFFTNGRKTFIILKAFDCHSDENCAFNKKLTLSLSLSSEA